MQDGYELLSKVRRRKAPVQWYRVEEVERRF